MEFCDECGAMMKADGEVWRCAEGHEQARVGDETTMTTTQGQVEDGPVDMSDVDEEDVGPTTRAQCPNPDCDSERARYEMKQIRAADESETRFFTCVECDKKWREDDH
ncbi:MAG: DNA-directed RNA polymerase, subunit M [uncultured archaeon A07HB70]|jgi:DNA-directed RNA polymerase, subunit M (EC 2.7.7.6)|nr:MAG: DNA-directed RNA polymerase, subunit M [uncultured archaeon A07HB70]